MAVAHMPCRQHRGCQRSLRRRPLKGLLGGAQCSSGGDSGGRISPNHMVSSSGPLTLMKLA